MDLHIRIVHECVRKFIISRSIKNSLHFHFMCVGVGVLPECMSLLHMFALPKEVTRGIISSATGVTEGCEPPFG